ncbi:MAG: Galactokinase [Anaerolineales bacterium]|nr:Galactokinase [Anaerolineales bacterium]
MSRTVSASAPGKVILFGEHAVVYGRPAIAVPVPARQATVTVRAGDDGLTIHATNLDCVLTVSPDNAEDPLAVAVINTLRHLDAGFEHDLSVQVKSTIPIGSGFGSSAAVSAALIQAIGRYFDAELTPADVSRLVYETEVLYHGTPSGIDNTVVAYAEPTYFVRQQIMDRFDVGRPMHLVIADTGRMTPTRETVGDVRAGWQRDPETYAVVFDAIGEIVDAARAAIAEGDLVEVGRLMDENHLCLRQLDVSSDELDYLVCAARAAGAMGAKMSGGGRGGNIVAIALPWAVKDVVEAVRAAGAVAVIETVV